MSYSPVFSSEKDRFQTFLPTYLLTPCMETDGKGKKSANKGPTRTNVMFQTKFTIFTQTYTYN